MCQRLQMNAKFHICSHRLLSQNESALFALLNACCMTPYYVPHQICEIENLWPFFDATFLSTYMFRLQAAFVYARNAIACV